MLDRLTQHFTPAGRAEAIRNVQRFLWATADVAVQIMVTLAVMVFASGAVARDFWRELRDRKHRCSKCGARAWVMCEVCCHERHHRRIE